MNKTPNTPLLIIASLLILAVAVWFLPGLR